jgi:hypothetical protein
MAGALVLSHLYRGPGSVFWESWHVNNRHAGKIPPDSMVVFAVVFPADRRMILFVVSWWLYQAAKIQIKSQRLAVDGQQSAVSS